MLAVCAPRGLPPRRARACTRVLPHRRLSPLSIAMQVSTFISMSIKGWSLRRLAGRKGRVITCVTLKSLPMLRFRGQSDYLVPVGGRDRGPLVPPESLPKLSLHMPRRGAESGEAAAFLGQAIGDPIAKPVNGIDEALGNILRIAVRGNLEDLH